MTHRPAPSAEGLFARSGRVVATAIDLPAPPDRVWDVLTRFDEWADWNPFIVRAAAPDGLRPKARLDLTMRVPGMAAQRFRPTVLVAAPGRELRWLGRTGLPGIFDGEHLFRLEALAGERTRLTQAERFGGLLAPALLAWMGDRLPAAFGAMDRALADRLEA